MGTQLTHGVQHSPGAKEQRTFLLAHFHVLRKFKTKMRKDKAAQLSHISLVPRAGDMCLRSHTDTTARVRVSSVAQHRPGKLIPGSGPVLIYFLGRFLLAWNLRAPRSHHFDTDPVLLISEGFLSPFSLCCLHQACWRCQGMNESFLILKGGESCREAFFSWECNQEGGAGARASQG